MRIQASAGRKKSIVKDGVEKLTLSQAKGHEAKKLKILFDEIQAGNLGFWVPLMWSMQQGKMPAKTEKLLEDIIARVEDDFWKAVSE